MEQEGEVINAKAIAAKMVKIEPRYLMGTEAYHQLGDIGRDDYDLFQAYGETEDYWVGAWICGYGFFNVCFPKETSRELTPEEKEEWNKKYIGINSQPGHKLNIK
jgi:hypothetical protein